MFAREGANLAINDINEKALAETAEKASELGATVCSLPADISITSAAQEIVNRACLELGRIDILVNNAGIVDYRPFTEINEELWDRMIITNLKSAFNCTRAVIVNMIAQRRGSIVNVTSVAGISGTPHHVHYSAAKAGMVGLTKALAKEVAQYGVRINAVAPAMINTAVGIRAQDYYKKALPNFSFTNPPLGIVGQPDDVAAACLYLASDEAKYITGQVISPNGGCWI
jgi:3-oxoacyl-[acyl-carrier protein] reductase